VESKEESSWDILLYVECSYEGKEEREEEKKGLFDLVRVLGALKS
jgi:hypothetical protein